MEADVVLLHLGQLVAQEFLEEIHERGDLALGAAPVLDGEGVKGEVLDAEIAAGRREVITDITGTIAHGVLKKFGATMQLSEPRIFSTVPDDPIEMPPAVFVQPLVWRKEHAYFVLGLASSEISSS